MQKPASPTVVGFYTLDDAFKYMNDSYDKKLFSARLLVRRDVMKDNKVKAQFSSNETIKYHEVAFCDNAPYSRFFIDVDKYPHPHSDKFTEFDIHELPVENYYKELVKLAEIGKNVIEDNVKYEEYVSLSNCSYEICLTPKGAHIIYTCISNRKSEDEIAGPYLEIAFSPDYCKELHNDIKTCVLESIEDNEIVGNYDLDGNYHRNKNLRLFTPFSCQMFKQFKISMNGIPCCTIDEISEKYPNSCQFLLRPSGGCVAIGALGSTCREKRNKIINTNDAAVIKLFNDFLKARNGGVAEFDSIYTRHEKRIMRINRIGAGACLLCKRTHDRKGWYAIYDESVGEWRFKCFADNEKPNRVLFRTGAISRSAMSIIEIACADILPPVKSGGIKLYSDIGGKQLLPMAERCFVSKYCGRPTPAQCADAESSAFLETLTADIISTFVYVNSNKTIYYLDTCNITKNIIIKEISRCSINSTYSGAIFNHKIGKLKSKQLIKYMTEIIAEKCWVSNVNFAPHKRPLSIEIDVKNKISTFNPFVGYACMENDQLLSKEEVVSLSKKFVNHISELWCDNNAKLAKLVHDWIGWIFQRGRTDVLLMVQGPPGCGKTMVGVVLCNIIGSLHSSSIGSLDAICDKFNEDDIGMKVLVHIDEAAKASADDSILTTKLKNAITAETVKTEQKFEKKKTIANYANYLLTTNSKVPMKVEADCRRIQVVTARPFDDTIMLNNKLYGIEFAKYHSDQRVLQAIYLWYMSRKLPEVIEIIMTEGKMKMIEANDKHAIDRKRVMAMIFYLAGKLDSNLKRVYGTKDLRMKLEDFNKHIKDSVLRNLGSNIFNNNLATSTKEDIDNYINIKIVCLVRTTYDNVKNTNMLIADSDFEALIPSLIGNYVKIRDATI